MIEELLDDRLDEQDRRALDEHLQQCEACQGYREAAVYALNALGDQPLPSPSEQAIDKMWSGLERQIEQIDKIDKIEADASRHLARGLSLRTVVGVSVAIAAVAAAIVVGFLFLWSTESEQTVAETVDESAEASEVTPEGATVVDAAPLLVLASGEAEVHRGGELVREATLQQGDQVRTTGDSMALFQRDPEVRLAVGPGTTFEVVSSARDALEVSLSTGWLTGRVDPSDSPLEVRVSTPAGMLRVLGTIFAVEVVPSDEVEVRVSRGEVAFHPTGDRQSVTISSGQAVSFPDGRIAGVAARVVDRDEALLEGQLLPEPQEVVQTVGVEELFERAEAARRGGQHRRAATLYRRIASLDRGAAGGTALISYGQLSLGPLRQPGQARQAFSSYLSSGRRSLRQEAFVGLLRAQRALGQTSGARSTARRYLGEYPDGRYQAIAEEVTR